MSGTFERHATRYDWPMYRAIGRLRAGESYRVAALLVNRIRFGKKYVTRVMNGNHKSLPSCVGGVSGRDDIADVWREHFDKLFTCIQDDDVNTRMINAEYSADIIVTSDEVAMAIRKLSTGKSSCLDGNYAEHLLHCRQRTMLAMCFTGLFVHVQGNRQAPCGRIVSCSGALRLKESILSFSHCYDWGSHC